MRLRAALLDPGPARGAVRRYAKQPIPPSAQTCAMALAESALRIAILYAGSRQPSTAADGGCRHWPVHGDSVPESSANAPAKCCCAF